MDIKERLIRDYPLTKKIVCDFECYEVIKRRYVLFIDDKIEKNKIDQLLIKIEETTKNDFPKVKSLIIVGYTDEEFEKEDLVYFNGVDTFVSFYLINQKNNHIYFNDKRMFMLSVDWKKIIRKFNDILDV